MSGGRRYLEDLQNVMVAEEAVYRSACMEKFIKKTDSGKVGRPINEEKACYFEMVCECLEKDGDRELYTLQELFAKMEELNSGNASTYSEKSLQSKLKEKYREHIYFTNLPGRPKIVFFRDMASYILYEQKKKTGETTQSIITAGAKLIKYEIRDLDKMNKLYPTLDQFADIKGYY